MTIILLKMNWGKYYEKKDKKKRKRKLGIFRIVLFGMLIYLVVTLFKQNLMMKELQGKKISLQNDISILEDEIEALNDEIENSDSLTFIEKVARDELGLVKPREIIVIDKSKIKNSFFNLFKGDNH